MRSLKKHDATPPPSGDEHQRRIASGARARRKGHAFEREVARLFAPLFRADVRRGLQYRDGADAPDVIVPGLWIECKVGKRTYPKAALEQAIAANTNDALIPVAVCKDDFSKPTATLRLTDFLHLLSEAIEFSRVTYGEKAAE